MKLIECPRDVIQSVVDFIPTNLKAKYINTLLRVGFDTIDFGSFVSRHIIPQMKDMDKLMSKLYVSDTNTKLIALIGSYRGAEKLVKYEEIKYIGFPFSASDTFLKLNIKSDTDRSLDTLSDIIELADINNKKVVVYMSMAFGNPYGDMWDIDIVLDKIDILSELGVKIINISDTLGISNEKTIRDLFLEALDDYPKIEFGFHLHTNKNDWYNKIDVAYKSGVRRFDTIIGGYGGYPLKGYDKISNVDTLDMIDYCFDKNININLDEDWLKKSVYLSNEIFEKYK
jgi:hydroxymethylglutaryl-CoA lyase